MPAFAPLRLRIAYWYADHRSAFFRLRIFVILGIFVLFLVGVGLCYWQWIQVSDHLVASELIAERTNSAYADFIQTRVPEQVIVSEVFNLPGGDPQTASYFVSIQNPNQSWGVSVLSYRFIVGGKIETGESFVLPGKETYIFAQGDVGANANFAITGMQWQRTRPGLQDLDVIFTVKKLQFTPQVGIKSGKKISNIARVYAEIENTSTDDFWEVPFVVIALGSSGNIVGIRSVDVDNVAANSTFQLEVNWVGALPNVKDVRILPQINLYDPAAHKKPADVPGEPK